MRARTHARIMQRRKGQGQWSASRTRAARARTHTHTHTHTHIHTVQRRMGQWRRSRWFDLRHLISTLVSTFILMKVCVHCCFFFFLLGVYIHLDEGEFVRE